MIGCRPPISSRLRFAVVRAVADGCTTRSPKSLARDEFILGWKAMNAMPTLVAALATVFFGAAVSAGMQGTGRFDIGKLEYEAKCMVCHGTSGKGDGSYSPLLTKRAADLTTLKKSNDGVFPVQRVMASIDGGDAVKAHRAREMPFWGSVYSSETAEAAEYFRDVPYTQEDYVRSRMLALATYLGQLQAN